MSVALWRVWFYTPTFDCWQCNPVSPSFSAVGCTKTPRHQSAPTAIRRALLNESPMAECDGRTLLFVARQERRQVDLLAATAFGYFCVHFCSPSPRTSHPPSVRRTPLESIGSIDPGGPSLAGQATSVLEVSQRRWNGASVCSQTGLESPPLPVHCDSAFPPKSVRKRAACRIGPASSLEQEGKGGGTKRRNSAARTSVRGTFSVPLATLPASNRFRERFSFPCFLASIPEEPRACGASLPQSGLRESSRSGKRPRVPRTKDDRSTKRDPAGDQ